jgi:hypothetical protein
MEVLLASFPIGPSTEGSAVFSDCGKYRYELSRTWYESEWTILWLLANPSIADATSDDKTSSKVQRISKNLGAGKILIGNVCAFIETKGADIYTCDDPVGPENLRSLAQMASEARMVVVAHGDLHPRLAPHAARAVAHLRAEGHKLHVLGLTQAGNPFHPLYQPDKSTPIEWPARAELVE